ncbi:hypothetical protein HMPREF9193_01701 [Treponema lecithinolyticum ATCC 700332]|uniref:Uncharacterized protein n=1 Tax=Treponema lecithinolyticum ATCC 700332 TaxID=1321815 RepID=A0ABN0NXA4_TRELE|nr:hypothetical protein HMPREF9193_01701 [Treponema lecithinolyticum ATCC 700332]
MLRFKHIIPFLASIALLYKKEKPRIKVIKVMYKNYKTAKFSKHFHCFLIFSLFTMNFRLTVQKK